MPIFQMKSQSASCTLEGAESDYRAARRVAQYRVGARAAYFPAFPGTKYLPYAAVDRVISKNSALSVTGCCGKQLPVIRVRLFYDGEFYQEFVFEKQKQADVLLDASEAAVEELPELHPAKAVSSSIAARAT